MSHNILWAFGDSFTATANLMKDDSTLEQSMMGRNREIDFDDPQDYKECIAKGLGLDVVVDSKDVSMMGTSNEFNVLRLNNLAARNIITEGDVVLFALAEPERQWHLVDVPWLGSMQNIYSENYSKNLIDNAPDGELRAYQLEILRAYQESILEPYAEKEGFKPIDKHFINYFSHIEMVKTIGRRLGVEVIILPTSVFTDIDGKTVTGMYGEEHPKMAVPAVYLNDYPVKGALGSISYFEIEKPHINYNKVMNNLDGWAGVDRRRNHISYHNHMILGEKIVKSVKEKTLLNLDVGFKTGFIDIHNSMDFVAKPYNKLGNIERYE